MSLKVSLEMKMRVTKAFLEIYVKWFPSERLLTGSQFLDSVKWPAVRLFYKQNCISGPAPNRIYFEFGKCFLFGFFWLVTRLFESLIPQSTTMNKQSFSWVKYLQYYSFPKCHFTRYSNKCWQMSLSRLKFSFTSPNVFTELLMPSYFLYSHTLRSGQINTLNCF